MSLTTDAKERKATPIVTGFLDYFPRAAAEVSRVSLAGNKQHFENEPLHWDKTKSTDHADSLGRHLLERGKIDIDGMRHTAKAAWRAMALLEIELEQEELLQQANTRLVNSVVESKVSETSFLREESEGIGIGAPSFTLA